jgi:LPS export ABC transporter protein LptC
MGPVVQETPHRVTGRAGAIVLAVSCLLLACKNDLDNVAAVEVPQAAPDRITEQADYFFTDSGQVRNRLRAGRIAEWALEPQRTELTEGLELIFFDSLGREASTLTARRGTILPKEKRMEVNEQVVVVNAKGERMETEQLTWLQDSGKVVTDKAVRVEREGSIIHGMGLDANEDFSRYTVRHITGILHVAEDDTLAR